MQVNTLQEYNHLKKLLFLKTKELNEIQTIIELNSHKFEISSKPSKPTRTYKRIKLKKAKNPKNIKRLN